MYRIYDPREGWFSPARTHNYVLALVGFFDGWYVMYDGS